MSSYEKQAREWLLRQRRIEFRNLPPGVQRAIVRIGNRSTRVIRRVDGGIGSRKERGKQALKNIVIRGVDKVAPGLHTTVTRGKKTVTKVKKRVRRKKK